LLCGRWRKHYHLKHHQESGQVTDVEERLIGLGLVRRRGVISGGVYVGHHTQLALVHVRQPWWNPKRILVTLTPAATLLVRHLEARRHMDNSA
jgi:hypothetical protein